MLLQFLLNSLARFAYSFFLYLLFLSFFTYLNSLLFLKLSLPLTLFSYSPSYLLSYSLLTSSFVWLLVLIGMAPPCLTLYRYWAFAMTIPRDTCCFANCQLWSNSFSLFNFIDFISLALGQVTFMEIPSERWTQIWTGDDKGEAANIYQQAENVNTHLNMGTIQHCFQSAFPSNFERVL